MTRRLDQRVRALERPVEVIDAPSERLPFADATFDFVVSTLVLCSVESLEVALAEVRRVLKPGRSKTPAFLVALAEVRRVLKPGRSKTPAFLVGSAMHSPRLRRES